MRTNWVHVIAASATTVVLLAATASAKDETTIGWGLDRAIFEVNLFNEDGKSGGFDQFVFAGGKLNTSEMRNRGCWGADYKVKPKNADATHFEAIFLTPEGQPVRVRGAVNGDTIDGSILWPESDDSMVWTYSGRRVQGLLDGSRFDIEVTSDGDAIAIDEEEAEHSNQYSLLEELEQGSDHLVFERGGLESRNCAAVGFSVTNYSAEQYNDTFTFAAQTAAENLGWVEWAGDVEGDLIEGTLQWTRPDGSVGYYSFTGKRVTG